jgi:hypothetical protein
MTIPNPVNQRVITIGLDPAALDFSRIPGLTPEILDQRIETGARAVRAAGLDAVSCIVGASPDEAEATLRRALAGDSFGVAMIGGGIRAQPEHTLLFERIVNVLCDAAPGIRLCFNTSPETTIDAIRRWIPAGEDPR